MFGVSRLTTWLGSPVRLGVPSLILSLTHSATASPASLGAHFDIFFWFRWGCVKHSNHKRHCGQHRVLWSICFSASPDNPLALTFQVITLELCRMITVLSWGWLRWRGCTLTAVDPVVVRLPPSLARCPPPPLHCTATQSVLFINLPSPPNRRDSPVLLSPVYRHNTPKLYVLTISGIRIWKVWTGLMKRTLRKFESGLMGGWVGGRLERLTVRIMKPSNVRAENLLYCVNGSYTVLGVLPCCSPTLFDCQQ